MIPTYLNSTVWCTLAPSKIHGVGVFAIRDIPKGQRLTDYPKEKELLPLSEADLELVAPEILSLLLDKMTNPEGTTVYKFYSPNSEQVLQSFMNHSTEANSDGFVALRDIKKGEEVTENYLALGIKPSKLNRANFNPNE